MDINDLDTALPFILSCLERHYKVALPEYTTMLIRSAVDSHLNGADDEKIDRTFKAIISEWGNEECSTIVELIEPIKAAIKETVEF